MEREKTQIYTPQDYMIPKVCDPQGKQKKTRQKKIQKARYQMIPTPMKYTCIANDFALYAVSHIFLSFFFLFMTYLIAKFYSRILD